MDESTKNFEPKDAPNGATNDAPNDAPDEALIDQAECRLLRILLDNMPQMAWIQSVDGKVGFWNKGVGDFFGFYSQSLDPIDWSRLIHPADLERSTARWLKLVETGTPYKEPFRLLRKDGLYRWLSINVFPVLSANGKITHIAGILTDIHDLEISRMRMTQLQLVATGLSGVITLQEAAQLVVDKGCLALEADRGFLCQLSPGQSNLDKVYEHGAPALDQYHLIQTLAIDLELPVPASFILGEPLFFENRAERIRRFPKTKPHAEASRNEGFIVIPIVVDSKSVGVLAFGFNEKIEIDENIKSFSAALASLCSQTIVRAQSYEIERKMRQKTVETEKRLQVALEASQIGLWEWNFKTGEQWVAGKYAQVFGYDELPKDWDILSVMEHCLPEDRNLMQSELDRFKEHLADTPFVFRPVRYLTPAGRIVWIQAVGDLARDAAGVTVGASGVMMDVTHQRDMEEALNRAKEEAESADRAKTSFVANMSHEFRTPLTAILGFNEFLSRDNLASEKRLNFTEGIRRNGQVLLKLVEDILDLSRVEAGKIRFDFQALNLQTLIEDVIEIFKNEIVKKGLSLDLEGLTELPQRFVSDPVRLRQILVNIVGNAVKFTEKGGLKISAKVREIGDANYLEMTVEDSGIGLLASQSHKLFQPFGQVENSLSRKFGGTGLGLFISRGLARALGGEIELLKSEPNIGSTFLVRVADQKDQPIAAGEVPEKEARRGEKFKGELVLVVEDTEDLREFLGTYLRELGCSVDFALNGQEAVQKIVEGIKFDTILMDLHMPIMDGYEATTKIREMGCGTPIVAITARNLPEDRLRCFEVGFDAFMSKPLSLRDLESTLRRLFRRRTRMVKQEN